MRSESGLLDSKESCGEEALGIKKKERRKDSAHSFHLLPSRC